MPLPKEPLVLLEPNYMTCKLKPKRSRGKRKKGNSKSKKAVPSEVFLGFVIVLRAEKQPTFQPDIELFAVTVQVEHEQARHHWSSISLRLSLD